MGLDSKQFDQAKMWHALEARRDTTNNPRHRQMLNVVIEHSRAEADRSVEECYRRMGDPLPVLGG